MISWASFRSWCCCFKCSLVVLAQWGRWQCHLTPRLKDCFLLSPLCEMTVLCLLSTEPEMLLSGLKAWVHYQDGTNKAWCWGHREGPSEGVVYETALSSGQRRADGNFRKSLMQSSGVERWGKIEKSLHSIIKPRMHKDLKQVDALKSKGNQTQINIRHLWVGRNNTRLTETTGKTLKTDRVGAVCKGLGIFILLFLWGESDPVLERTCKAVFPMDKRGGSENN